MWLLIDKASGAVIGSPLVEEPADDDEAAYAVHTVIGYPDRMAWSPTLRAFVEVPKSLYTFNQWVDLFPLEEQIAIVTATMSDPMTKLIYDRAQSASGSIDPTDPRTAQGLGYLVSKGYVSPATFERITGEPAA